MSTGIKYFATVSFLLFSLLLFSQGKNSIDGLLLQLNKTAEDTSRSNLLYEIAKEFLNQSDNSHALDYAKQNMLLSRKLGYEKGIANSYHILGSAAIYSGQYDSANYFLREALHLRQGIKDKSGITTSFLYLGLLNSMQGNYDTSLSYYNNALKRTVQFHDSIVLGKVNLGLGQVHFNMGNYPPALEYYLASLSVFEKTGDKKLAARAIGNIGLVYSYLGKLDEAIHYYQQSLDLKKVLGDTRGIAYSLENIGGVYTKKHIDDSALFYFRQSLPLSEQIGDKKLIASDLSYIAIAFLRLNQPDSAQYYNDKGYELRKQTNDKDGMVHSLMNKGQIFSSFAKRKNDKLYYDKAITAYEEALTGAEEMGKKEWTLSLFLSLAESHAAAKNYTKAYDYQLQYSKFSDSIKSETFTRQIAEMQAKYETEKKDKEISLLNADKEISYAKISRQRILNYGLIAIAFFIIVSAYLIYRNIQHKRKAEAQYAALEKQHAIETMRSKISIDIHDDLGSGLTKIGLLTQQIQDKKDSPQAFTELMNKIQSLSKEVVTGLREVIWASNPANDNLASLLSFMRNYIHRFFEGTSFKYDIDFPDDVPEMNIHPEVKRNLFLTLKESLNNMAKHSEASEVIIRFVNIKEKFSFEITDNGNGFDSLPPIGGEGRGGAGNGLRNMKKRMEDIKATLELISTPGQGVKIAMEGTLY